MASFIRGEVTEVVEEFDDLVRAKVSTDTGVIDTVGFPDMLGPLKVGDKVVVNATGLDLGLGTGGIGFILWNEDGELPRRTGPGHIVKMRYTPWQTDVTAAEAQESPHHEALKTALELDRIPVIACGLHSQIAGVAAGIRAAEPDARIGYLMTDGAALPIAWSDLVRDLKRAGFLDATATSGHAFGGDLEVVNVFSGLVALRKVTGADYVIAAMGPGVVGTDTALGFTAMEQGPLLDAAGSLGGKPVACLRISFADPRQRHSGVSHHTLTALTIGTRGRCSVAVPKLAVERAARVTDDLESSGLVDLHDILVGKGEPGIELLRARGVEPSSMGRRPDDDPDFWLACAAAGDVAASLSRR
jgi:Protein of unknown function (DUF3866)